jgi:hypothetical protein
VYRDTGQRDEDRLQNQRLTLPSSALSATCYTGWSVCQNGEGFHLGSETMAGGIEVLEDGIHGDEPCLGAGHELQEGVSDGTAPDCDAVWHYSSPVRRPLAELSTVRVQHPGRRHKN